MPILLLDIERELNAADERAEQLGARLLYVAELFESVSQSDDESRAAKLDFLHRERVRLVAEINLMLAAAAKLEPLRDQALAGLLD